MIPDWMISNLQCPNTLEPLSPATEEQLAKLAHRFAARELVTKLGVSVSELPMQGLVNASFTWFYRIDGPVVDLLAEEGIRLSQQRSS